MRITKRIWFGGLAFLAAVTAAGTPAMAQQTTGTPGSPGATTTIDGRYLPGPRRRSSRVTSTSMLLSPSRTGRPALCRLKARPMCC